MTGKGVPFLSFPDLRKLARKQQAGATEDDAEQEVGEYLGNPLRRLLTCRNVPLSGCWILGAVLKQAMTRDGPFAGAMPDPGQG